VPEIGQLLFDDLAVDLVVVRYQYAVRPDRFLAPVILGKGTHPFGQLFACQYRVHGIVEQAFLYRQ
jgi:hypothetical protein